MKKTKKSQRKKKGKKRTPNAYMLFAMEQMKKMKGDVKDRFKKIGSMWRKMSDTDKKPYVDKSKRLKKKKK
jgi:high mobility group protein B3